MELTANDLEIVFGRRLDTLSERFKEDSRNLYLIYENLGDIRKTLEGSFRNIMSDMRRSLENLAEKISAKQANGEKTSDIKINDILDNVSDTIAEVQKNSTEKITSNFSYNFRSLNDQLKIVNEAAIDANKEELLSLKQTVERKIDQLTTVIQGAKTVQKNPQATKSKSSDNTATELLLTQQLMVLEKLKESVDTKLNATLDAVSSTERILAKKAKMDRLNPPEVSFSKKDRKLLQAIDASDEVTALTKEVKESKKLDSNSGIGKFLSPFLVLLGAVGAIAFGAFKFPSIKKLWNSFTQTKLGGGIMSFFKSITPKGMDMKEFVRGIPFVGRLVDLWDALDLLHQGKTKEGLKQLAFVVPGMEYIAALLGTSKERMLGPGYNKAGDKSVKLFGFSFEQMWHGLTNIIDTVFKPVMNFFNNAFGTLGEGFNLLMKGTSMNYDDIANTWDKITTDYFPVLKPVANIIKWVAKSAFDWTAKREKGAFKINDETGEIVPLDMGDVISNVWGRIQELFTDVSNSIKKAFDYVKTVISALGMVFSGEKSEQLKGLGLLERQGMGALADGIGMFLNVMDSVKQMAGPDGKIGMWELTKGVWNGINVTSGPFGREARRTAMYDEGEQKLYSQAVEAVKKDQELAERERKIRSSIPLDKRSLLYRILFSGQYQRQNIVNPNSDEFLLSEADQRRKLEELGLQRKGTTGALFEKRLELLKRSGMDMPSLPEEYGTMSIKPSSETKTSEVDLESAATDAATALYSMKEVADSWSNINTTDSALRDFQEKERASYDIAAEETQKQTQAILELKTQIKDDLIPLLQETALISKQGNQYLEATSKGVGKMSDKPSSSYIINNSNRTNIMKQGIGDSLSFKSLVHTGRGLVPMGA